MNITVHADPVDIAAIGFHWMVGQTVLEFARHEPDLWTVALSRGGAITTQDRWRLVRQGRMLVASADHAQQFVKTDRLDAGAAAMEMLAGSALIGVTVGQCAPDLHVSFANGVELQVLATSVACECWQVRDDSGRCFVVNGSRDAATWRE